MPHRYEVVRALAGRRRTPPNASPAKHFHHLLARRAPGLPRIVRERSCCFDRFPQEHQSGADAGLNRSQWLFRLLGNFRVAVSLKIRHL